VQGDAHAPSRPSAARRCSQTTAPPRRDLAPDLVDAQSHAAGQVELGADEIGAAALAAVVAREHELGALDAQRVGRRGCARPRGCQHEREGERGAHQRTVTTIVSSARLVHGSALPAAAAPLSDLPLSGRPFQVPPLSVTPLKAPPLRARPFCMSPFKKIPFNENPLNVTPLKLTPLKLTPLKLTPL
jgi:hypothetical protein